VRANGLRIETRAVTVVVGGGEEAATTELEEIDDGTA
jgi:hypothetical protein